MEGVNKKGGRGDVILLCATNCPEEVCFRVNGRDMYVYAANFGWHVDAETFSQMIDGRRLD